MKTKKSMSGKAYVTAALILACVFFALLFDAIKDESKNVQEEKNIVKNPEYIICRSGGEEAYFGEKFNTEYFEGFEGFADGRYWICE